MQTYEEMADFYDLVYPDRNDRDFYVKEGRKAKGKILEVACGTGRILLSLMKEGLPASGLDISPAMLEALRKKALESGMVPRLFQADMRDFSLGEKFSLIIVPFRSFHHLKDGRERLSALKCFRAHLEEGGRLILHLTVPQPSDRALTGRFHRTASEKIAGGKAEWLVKFSPDGGSADYRIVLSSDSGKRREFRMTLHFVGLEELSGALKSVGFKNVNIHCGFGYSPLREGCEEAVVIAY